MHVCMKVQHVCMYTSLYVCVINTLSHSYPG